MEIWARVSAGLTEPQGSLERWQGLWHESRLDHLSPKRGPRGRVKQGEGWLLTNSTCWMTVSLRTVPGKAEAGLDLQAVVWLWHPSFLRLATLALALFGTAPVNFLDSACSFNHRAFAHACLPVLHRLSCQLVPAGLSMEGAGRRGMGRREASVSSPPSIPASLISAASSTAQLPLLPHCRLHFSASSLSS